MNKFTTILFFLFFDIICISTPPSTFVYSIAPLCLYLSYRANVSTFSLLTPPLIFLNIIFLVYLLNFCTLGMTREEWEKRKCERWNGREGRTFIFGGPTELIPEINTLFAKHGIDSRISICLTRCTFSLDSKNGLLLKHSIDP